MVSRPRIHVGRSFFLWREVSGYKWVQERSKKEGEEAVMALMI